MKNDQIYKYLNEVETDYEEIEIPELEMDRLKKFARSNSKKKKFFGRKFAGLAAAVLLAFGTIIGANENVRAEVISYVEKFFTEVRVPMNEAKGIPEEVQKYTVNLHETVQLKYASFVVEDVMIDGKNGYLNLIYPEEYSHNNSDIIYFISKVYVNGEENLVSSSGSTPTKIENGLVSDIKDFKLDKEMPENEDLNLVIVFENFNEPEDRAAIETNISMARLSVDSKVYLKDFKISGAEDYKIDMMKINLINPRIEMSEPDPVRNYRDNYKEYTEIIGTNDEGKIIAFTMNSGRAVRDSLGVKTYETVYKFVPKDDVENFGKISDYSIEELNNLNDTFEFQIYRSIFDKEPITGKWILQEVEILGEPFVVELGDK